MRRRVSVAQAVAFRRAALATGGGGNGNGGGTAALKDVLEMHESIIRDPSTIPTVVSAGGATYDAYRAMPGRATFLDAHPNGFTYGPIANHPQEANVDVTVTGPGNLSDLQSVCDAQASDAVIGIDGTFTGGVDARLHPKADQTLVGIGATAVLDGIGLNDNNNRSGDVYNIAFINYVDSDGDSGNTNIQTVFLGTGRTINHCDIDNGHVAGLGVGNDQIVEYCRLRNNGRYGMKGIGVPDGNADRSVVRYCLVRNNNVDDAGNTNYPDTVDAGAMKFVSSEDVTIHDCWYDDNRGNGIWIDGVNPRFTGEWNLLENNDEAGLFYELGQKDGPITEIRYNISIANRWGLMYSDCDAWGHHNLIKDATQLPLYFKQRKADWPLVDLREENSIIYHNPASKSGINGWVVAVRLEDGVDDSILAVLGLSGMEYHLTAGAEAEDWYYTREDGQAAETHTVAEWEALGYETNATRHFDQ